KAQTENTDLFPPTPPPEEIQIKPESQAGRDSLRAAKRAALASNRVTTLYYYDKNLQCGVPLLDTIDRSLNNFQIYDKVFKNNYFSQTRDLGHADQPIGYMPDFTGSIFLRNNPFATWKYTVENTPFYQTQSPYSSLYYMNNFGKEINFLNAIISLNVARGLNLALDFNVLSWFGEYENSGSNQMNFRGYGNYITKSGRYRVQGGYIFNRSQTDENGGMQDDGYFTSNSETNRLSIPTYLSQANNHYRENMVFLKHSYHFYGDRHDTIPENDFSLGYIGHEFLFKQNREMYHDAGWGNFYSTGRLNEKQSDDTVNSYRFSNRVYYTTGDMEKISNAPFRFKIAGGIKNEFVYFRDAVKKETMFAWFPFVQAQFTFAGRFVLNAYGDFSFSGQEVKIKDVQNFNGYVSAKFLFPKQKGFLSNMDGISVTAGFLSHAPDYIYSYHLSNHFEWRNNWLAATNVLYGGFDFLYKGWWLNAKASYINNHTFFRQSETNEGDLYVAQSESPFLVAQLALGKDLIIAKYVGLNSKLQLSYSSNENYIHVPLFNMQESIFGIIPMPGNGTLHVGFDLYYRTSYYADAYNPALVYYVWQDKVKTGNYFIMDFFVTLKVKRMNIFLKGQNLLQGAIKPYNYIDTPHYALKDRCFRFGLVWRFYD
ncbi:MAG: putative porin, partial [Bacteroidales bacterium]|nr:putative porin [Bacteroidales bacterium]